MAERAPDPTTQADDEPDEQVPAGTYPASVVSRQSIWLSASKRQVE